MVLHCYNVMLFTCSRRHRILQVTSTALKQCDMSLVTNALCSQEKEILLFGGGPRNFQVLFGGGPHIFFG